MKVTIGKVTLIMYFLLKLQHSIKRKKQKDKLVDNHDSAIDDRVNSRDFSQRGSSLP